MWGGMSGGPPPPPMGGGRSGGYGGQQQNQQQKHDIFVGNLAFSTTEEQLHQAFSEIGKIIKVRMVSDENGKPRGFAFIEFEDPQAALSAIRNMNDYELNGRRIRVNFSNSSHLETLAGKLGMDMSQHTQQRSGGGKSGADDSNSGTQAVADALKGMSKGEMYDVVAKLKEIAEKDPDEARRLLCGHPQLPEAILHLMSRLDMIKTPLTAAGGGGPMDMPPPTQDLQPAGVAVLGDPRMRASDPRAGAPSDPRAVRVDPRAAARAQQPPPLHTMPPPPGAGMAMPPPPMGMGQPPGPGMQPPMGGPPPNFSVPPPGMPPPPQQQQPGVAGLDPALVQQVMSLTHQQIAQLPPDKQQSILALRQQITGGR